MQPFLRYPPNAASVEFMQDCSDDCTRYERIATAPATENGKTIELWQVRFEKINGPHSTRCYCLRLWTRDGFIVPVRRSKDTVGLQQFRYPGYTKAEVP